MGIAITKVQISPQTVDAGAQVTISVYAYEITNGAGERRLPFRLVGHQFKTIVEKLPIKLGMKGRL